MNGKKRDRHDVLPLPLVPFEKYMLIDDRPAYPMNFFMRLNFSGSFDRDKLDAALREVVVRHPLLNARVWEDKQERLQWVNTEGEEPVVRWVAASEVNGYPHCRGLDPRRCGGLRVLGRHGDGGEGRVAYFLTTQTALARMRLVLLSTQMRQYGPKTRERLLLKQQAERPLRKRKSLASCELREAFGHEL